MNITLPKLYLLHERKGGFVCELVGISKGYMLRLTEISSSYRIYAWVKNSYATGSNSQSFAALVEEKIHQKI